MQPPPSVSLISDYSDPSFDEYINKVIKDGTLDHLEENALLRIKVRELEEQNLAATQTRVAQENEEPKVVKNPTKEDGYDTQVISETVEKRLEAIEAKMKSMEASMKSMEAAILRIEASITYLKETTEGDRKVEGREIVVRTAKEADKEVNEGEGVIVSDTYLQGARR